MKNIRTVGIVGAGKMGSALAQKFAQEGFDVVLADRQMTFVEQGLNGIKATLNEAIKRNLFTYDQANGFLSRLRGADQLTELAHCDLIIEAIFEDFEAKTKLFRELSKVVSPDAIVATNTSSFSITELSAAISNPERFIGLHYFYHAAKNRLVEIVPGEKTSNETLEAAYRFSVLSGKDPISSLDAHGFVVNRFFVPWLNEAVRLHAEKHAITRIEKICRETFGIGMGPFELMNVTGIPVAYHAEKTLAIFGRLYAVAPELEAKAFSGMPWPLSPAESEEVSADTTSDTLIRERMLGLVFFICSQILDEKVCSATEIDRGAKIGLRWKKGPVEMMRSFGAEEVFRLVANIASRYSMPMPQSIAAANWETVNVKLKINKEIAVITMDQPESLNALSVRTMRQLGECFALAENNPDVRTIFITGSGKAFVAGADIRFFVNNIKKDRICDIETFTEAGQRIFEQIETSPKKVIALINGLALGGGLELALCADVILATPKAAMAFPETGIGIYPGLGGTQRTSRRIGKGLGKYLIFTGKMLSAEDACSIGLVDGIISTEEMFALLNNEMELPATSRKPLEGKWETLNRFFEKNDLNSILGRSFSLNGLSASEADRIVRSVTHKAPIALKLAGELIDKEQGCASELKHLREIFSTADALRGLTSIGQKVEFEGK